MKAKIIARDGKAYDVQFPESENNFRFFPALSKIAGTTTNGIAKLTVDSIIMPKELFKRDIMGDFLTLKANVLVGEIQLSIYELEIDIKIPSNAYVAQNIKSCDDSLLVEIAPLQIEIPAYEKIRFIEMVD